jgi:hypothetical protein
MKVLLGMMARSDGEPYLDQAVSIMRSSFDGVEIQLDGGQPITDFSAARNRLISFGESNGYDWMFMLDADECMYPDDISGVRSLMELDGDFIALPRINLVNDSSHWEPSWYPDYQGRVFRLGRGYHYRNQIHEQLYPPTGHLAAMESEGFARSDDTPIYHFGMSGSSKDVLDKWQHYESISEESTGLRSLDADSSVLRPDAPEFPYPNPLDGSSRSSGGWADISKTISFHSPAQDIQFLHKHSEFIGDLSWSGARLRPLLGIGVNTAPVSRLLGSPTLCVTIVDSNDIAIKCVTQINTMGMAYCYEAVNPFEIESHFDEHSFEGVFSIGFLHRFEDDQIRELIAQQLRVADKTLFSVPSDRHPKAGQGDGRYLTPGEWEHILAPIGTVHAWYYGRHLLPLRQALSAKLHGTLHQDRLYVSGVISNR